MKVFLGGTCNGSTWRDALIKKLKIKNIDYFNPVVDVWNKEAQEKEEIEKDVCFFRLYVITPKMTGVYSIAEVVDDSNKIPERTLFCVLEKYDNDQFSEFQIKSLNATKLLVKSNGAKVFDTLDEICDYLEKTDVIKENKNKIVSFDEFNRNKNNT